MKNISWKLAGILFVLVSLNAYAQPAWTYNTPNNSIGTTSKVGVGTTTPTYAFQFIGSLTTGSGTQYGAFFGVTSAGTAASAEQASEVELYAGYTGTGTTAALGFRNAAAGQGTSVDVTNIGNYGVYGITTGTTVGDNAGMVGYSANGNNNFGVVGNAQVAKSGGKNVGVLGYGYNNAADVAIGGYFALGAASQKARFTTAALIADNADLSATAPIFLGRSNGTNKFVIDKDGNVNVSGTLTATSVVNAVYGQDVAEWVQADRDLPAGTVVILNPEKNNQVISSSTAYDTTIAGVVSSQPGVILGRPGAQKCTVATSGRVRVRVDATKGAIHIGDLLVTSDEPGTAMKSQPIEVNGRHFHQPGTILGKALEPLEDGKGEILVLLSLG